MDSTKKMLYRPPGIAQPVRTEEVVVVVIVLLVWALCVYIFFHQWGKCILKLFVIFKGSLRFKCIETIKFVVIGRKINFR